LTNTANDFRGSVSVDGAKVEVTDATALQIGGTAAGDATVISGGELTFATTIVSGNLKATSLDAIRQLDERSTLTVDGTTELISRNGNSTKNIVLANTGNEFQGTVTVDGEKVVLSDATDLTVKGRSTSDSTLSAGGDLVFGTTTVGGNLKANAKGSITQSEEPATLKVRGTSELAAIDGTSAKEIKLANQGNDFGGAVTVNGAKVSLNDTNALMVGGVATGDAVLTSGERLVFANTVVGGNLSATAKDAISQTAEPAEIRVRGTSKLIAKDGETAKDVTLANSGNDFRGTVTVDGAKVTITDVNDLTLGGDASDDAKITTGGALVLNKTEVKGNLTAASQGDIRQSQASTLVVAKDTTLSAIDGQQKAHDITLDNAGNQFGGEVNVLNGNQVTIRDSDTAGLKLGTNVTGSIVFLRSGGDIFQDREVGVIAVKNELNLQLPKDKSILLGSPKNELPEKLEFSAVDGNGNATTDALNTIDLASKNDLVVDPALRATDVILASYRKSITATNSANAFDNLSVPDGATARIVDSKPVRIVAGPNGGDGINLKGDLELTAAPNVSEQAGAITQTAPIVVSGKSVFKTFGGNSIYLNNPANKFGEVDDVQAVEFQSTTNGPLENVQYWQEKSITLNNLTISGTLDLNSTAGFIRLNTKGDDQTRPEGHPQEGGFGVQARVIRAVSAPDYPIEIVGRTSSFDTTGWPSSQSGGGEGSVLFSAGGGLYLFDGINIIQGGAKLPLQEILKRQAVSQIYSPVGLGDTPPLQIPLTIIDTTVGIEEFGLKVYSTNHPTLRETTAR
ncbi:MAG: hypothetical protein IT581_17900, partial [Verrucomicrobiales bacterium]|nr:hypothetical protein [Verrucomicrobiales bacterium]